MELYNCIIDNFNYIILCQEQEEEGGGGYYYEIPSNEDELNQWWEIFYHRFKYPFYGIIMATNSDSEVVSLIKDHREEIAEISGKECCFVYFRDIRMAQTLTPHQFSEHSKWVYPLAKIIGIDYGNLPCLLFFEQIISGEYIVINLKDKSQSEIISIIRDLFGYVRRHKWITPFSALKRFKRSIVLRVSISYLKRNISQLIEILKSLVSML